MGILLFKYSCTRGSVSARWYGDKPHQVQIVTSRGTRFAPKKEWKRIAAAELIKLGVGSTDRISEIIGE